MFYCGCPHAGVEERRASVKFLAILAGDGDECGDGVEVSGDVITTGSWYVDEIFK